MTAPDDATTPLTAESLSILNRYHRAVPTSPEGMAARAQMEADFRAIEAAARAPLAAKPLTVEALARAIEEARTGIRPLDDDNLLQSDLYEARSILAALGPTTVPGEREEADR
jgi:hypothetical protein